jgi:ABC-type multidrug transport system ATPase subunit
MSEQILEAIIRLLAIVAREDDVTLDEKATIANFLVDNVTMDDAARYLQTFEELAESQESQTEEQYKKDIEQICNQINAEQTSKQKMVIVLYLIQLIAADGTITERENNLVFYICEKINIPKDVTNLVKSFVIYQERAKITSSNILIIDNGSHSVPDQCNHLIVETLEGFIFVLRIAELDVFFVKYIGEETVTMNGTQMRHNHIYILTSGAIIKTEKNESIFHSDIISQFLDIHTGTKVSLVAKNVGFKFRNGQIGLQNINLAEDGGKLIAIMGGSGSGKSTLLNVLNGNEKPYKGYVSVNGYNLHQSKSETDGIIGYIPQDDLLVEELTVFENLYFAAKLCFKDKSEFELKELTEKTIESLGLLEAKDLKVGSPLEKSISGGQRKRVNIGLELLREPSILYVDEPTSGLSSRDSENIMELLKELSLKGKMIFVVIHQPSEDIYRMFDKLILLDVGGYQIYYGNPIEAISYFKEAVNMLDRHSTNNPEQIFNIVESKLVDEYGRLTKNRKITPAQWHEKFQKKIALPTIEESTELPEKNLKVPNRFKQFLIFAHRDILSKLSNRQYLLINSLEAPLLAFLLAGIIRYTGSDSELYSFRENVNIPVYFFMSVIVALFMGLTVSAEEIIRDRKILKREKFLNLSRASYLGSKMGILFTISAVQTLTFVVIGNWILDVKDMTLTMWLTLFSVSSFANILGLNVSAALKSAVTVYILIPLLIIPQLILSGVVVNFDKLNPVISNEKHVPLIGDIMASRWAYEALAVGQYKDNRFERQFFEYDKTIGQSEFKTIYHITKLETALEYVKSNYQKPGSSQKEIEKQLTILRKEINDELYYIGKDEFPEVEELVPDKLNPTLFEKTADFLKKLKAYYNLKSKKATTKKNEIVDDLLNNENGKDQFVILRDHYQNEAISALVRNLATQNRIVEVDGELVQKLYPIYKDPEFPAGPLDIRAHFYSPTKHFAGKWYDTVYFNIAIIWAMILILVVTLYFDLLKKLLQILSTKKP